MLSKVIAQANIDHAEKWFERADKIVIVTHVSPDGDAIGSLVRIMAFLGITGKDGECHCSQCFSGFSEMDAGAKDIIGTINILNLPISC